MNVKRLLAALMALTMMFSLAACKGDEEENPETPTVTGGSAEDVFDLNELAQNGEDVTIDAGLIDADTGEVTTGKTASKTTTQKQTTTKPNIKNETTVSGNVSASSTATGYKISWNAVSGAKKYNVYRADSKDGTYQYLGSTTDTFYVDKNGSSKYFYKITVANDGSASTGFKGSTKTFTNQDGDSTFISSNLNNTYISYVRNEYAKKGITCPPGRLAYVQIDGSTALYVFQFDNTKTWNSATLEQVHIFETETGTAAYFSFFTKDEGSAEYLAAKEAAKQSWNKTNNTDSSVKYDEMQAFFLMVAEAPDFQAVIDASY